MSIEVSIKYTDQEYMDAVKEKLPTIPNKALHTFLPAVIVMFLIALLMAFDKATTWWGLAIIIAVGLYAALMLVSDWVMPKIALLLNRKKKLDDVYDFCISEESVSRASSIGKTVFTWQQIVSIDFYEKSIFLNIAKGSMLIPVSRLSVSQLALLKEYADQ